MTKQLWLIDDKDSGELSIDAVKAFIQELDEANIEVRVNILSNGGDIDFGNAIYDAVKAHPYLVTGVVYGAAASAGSYILQACDVRIMMPSASLMIHHGTLKLNGEPLQVIEQAKKWKVDHFKFLNAYANRMKQSDKYSEASLAKVRAQLYKKLQQFGDWRLTAGEALEEGLIDSIWE